MDLQHKLEILADAAKHDASCASSGAARKDSCGSAGVGSAGGAGICHSYAPDGRCISLLKVLLTNTRLYDCHYCISRRSSNVQRARFTPDEVVRLTLDFYKRNFIEGLFLSSGIIRSADYTKELVIDVARKLREEHHFRGYIHLKTIPEVSPALIEMAGRYADRISINIDAAHAAGAHETRAGRKPRTHAGSDGSHPRCSSPSRCARGPRRTCPRTWPGISPDRRQVSPHRADGSPSTGLSCRRRRSPRGLPRRQTGRPA
jgi:predicted DNA-binding helix-hairpin-helix protein